MNHYEGDENSVSTGVNDLGIGEGIDDYHRHLSKGLRDYGSGFQKLRRFGFAFLCNADRHICGKSRGEQDLAN